VKDKRITASRFSLKQFGLIFLLVLFTCANYHIIYINGIGGRTNTIIHAIILLVGLSLVGAFLIGLFKYLYFDKPIRTVASAAQKVANGDFNVNVPYNRKDGKKDEITVLIEDFNKMTNELSSIETLKTDFVSNVSHEIKTPLSIIQNYTVALQDDRLSKKERTEYCKTIIEASKRLTELITNILKLDKLENQKIMPKSELYSLDEQLRECVLNFENLLESKNITVICDNIEPLKANYDKSLLELVWNNLISNAIKFTDKNGTITISLKNRAVTIQDTGCGMNDETVKHIFDKFYQGDTSHSTEGNGLGLTLVKKIIDIYNCGITVQSEMGKGTTFLIKL
jgi:signal transduction histidine kinase